MEQVNISTRYVKSMLKFAQYRQCNMPALMQKIGISQEEITSRKSVSIITYGELYQAIVDQLEDEWFGLLKDGNVRKGSMRFLLRSLIHCRSLEDAIQTGSDFFEISYGYTIKQQITLASNDAIIYIKKLNHVEQQRYDNLLANVPIDIIKSTLLAFHGINNWLTGEGIPIKELFYTFSEEEDKSNNPDTKISHNQDFCGYRIDSKYLQFPIVQLEKNIDTFIRRAPYFVFMHSKKEGLSQQIRAILARSLGDHYPTADEIAQTLNMSTQTLFRKLKAEGVSYVELKNSMRGEMAIHYLTKSELNNEAISELLGFENPSTFYRTFKKWTGLSPGAYRKASIAKNTV